MNNLIVAGTGHRPNKLGGYGASVNLRLKQLAVAALKNCGATTVVSGMALGWDMALAEAAIELNIPFIAAVPFKGQELMWPTASQKRYNEILGLAESVVIVSEGGYSAHKMQIRNLWMINNADLILALWDGSSGGTANCINASGKKPIQNLWASWERHR